MTKNASNFLSNFPLEENETIVVDSFSYISNKNKTTYVGFLTNLRFIFRQAQNVSLSGMGIQDGLFESEYQTVPLNRIRGLKLKKGRLIINGDIYDGEGKHTASDFGSFGKGFGGLSYSSHDEVFVRILEAVSEAGKEHDFYLWTPDNPEYNTADETQQKRLTNITQSELKTALLLSGGVVGVLFFFTTFEFLWPFYLLGGAGFGGYKFVKSQNETVTHQ